MQMAGHATLDRFDLLAGARRVSQHAARIAPKRAPGLREFKRPATQEQRRADQVFHVAEPVRERRLRHVHGLGGAGDAARAFQGGQHLQVAKLEPAGPGRVDRGSVHAEMVMDLSGLFISLVWPLAAKMPFPIDEGKR
ncbi:hypothetical protein D9M69_548420 [compost metagenome]